MSWSDLPWPNIEISATHSVTFVRAGRVEFMAEKGTPGKLIKVITVDGDGNSLKEWSQQLPADLFRRHSKVLLRRRICQCVRVIGEPRVD